MSFVSQFLPRTIAALSPLVLVLVVPGIRESQRPATAAASAEAFEYPAELPRGAFVPPSMTQEQLAAAEYLPKVRKFGTAEIPFLRPESQPEPSPADVADTAQGEDRPVVTLTSILAGTRPIAMVNGKPMTVGQTLSGDWVLAKIDAQAGLVRFEDRFDAAKFFTAKLHQDRLPGG